MPLYVVLTAPKVVAWKSAMSKIKLPTVQPAPSPSNVNVTTGPACGLKPGWVVL